MQQLSQELDLDEARTFRHQVGSPLANSPPGKFIFLSHVQFYTILYRSLFSWNLNLWLICAGNWAQYGSPVEHSYLSSFSKSPVTSNHSSGLAAILSPNASNPTKIAPIGKDSGRLNSSNQTFTNGVSTQGVAFQNSLSFPELKVNASSRPIASFSESSSASSSIGTLSGPQFLWGSPTTSYTEHSNTSAWSSSSTGLPFTSSGEKQGFPYATRPSSFLSTHSHHHVGSAPSGLPLDRHFNYYPESPETSFMSPASYGSINHSDGNFMNMGARAASGVIGLSGNTSEINSSSFRLMSMARHSSLFLGNGSYSGVVANSDPFTDRSRSRRPENSVTQIDSKKQYQLDLDKIISGEDTRTTLMIKNIPNKYECQSCDVVNVLVI